MAGKNTNISLILNAKINGKETVAELTTNYAQLGKAVEMASKATRNYSKEAATSNIIYSTSTALQTLQTQFNSLNEAYATQIEVERKLEVAMRNTMGATDEEIQSIKDLCSAQQKLGIVGDEVQLAGAQELSTYLSLSSSLRTLIPVMNDMIAQQYGYGASCENATNIATMMGKVMEGQTGALKRYGYSFDAAQEQILKFGTEEERAAVLAQVVSASVGGMNAELAKTPAGKMQQLKNIIGDLKEDLGSLISYCAPFVSALSQVGMAAMAVGQLKTAFTTLTTAVKASTTAVKGLSTAIKVGLASTGIGLAIWAAGEAISYFTGKTDDAKESVEQLSDAERRQTEMHNTINQSVASVVSKYDSLKNAYQNLSSEHEKTKWLKKNKEAFRELGLQVKDLNSAEDIFVRRADNVAEALKLRAKAAAGDAIMTKAYEDYYNRMGKLAAYKANGPQKYVPVTAAQFKPLTVEHIAAGVTEDDYDSELNYTPGTQYTITTYREKPIVKKKMDHWYEKVYKNFIEEQTKLADDQLKKDTEYIQTQIEDTAKKLQDLNVDDLVTDPGGGGYADPTIDVKADIKAPEGSLKKLQEDISKKKMEIDMAIDPESRRQLYKELQELERREYFIKLSYTEPDQRIKGERIVQFTKHTPDIDQKKVRDQMNAVLRGIDPSKYDEIIAKQKKLEETTKSLSLAGTALSALGNIVGNFAGMTDDATSAWLSYTASVLGNIGQVISAFKELAVAKGASEAAGSGPFGWIVAIAATAGLIAAMASIPKFAKGGIAYGPTLGLFGEYTGASNNPEVVAPLDRLRTMLEPRDYPGGKVEFEIEGRKLVGLMNKVNRFNSRTS